MSSYFLTNSLGNLFFLPEQQHKQNNSFELSEKVAGLSCDQDGKLLHLKPILLQTYKQLS